MNIEYDVFISYSRRDYIDENNNVIPDNVVSKIKEALTNAGISYWFDEEGIYSGQNFVEKIINNIEASQVFIFLSTANANSSRWTSKEIASADELHKHIIPVRIDNTPYNKKVLFRISELDYIEYYSNPEKATKDLISAIKAHLAQVREEEERKREEERKKREIETKREEEEKRKREENQRRFCEEQQRLIDRIRLDCTALNNEETKLELDRQNLLIRVETVADKEQRKELQSLVESSSPIGKKYEERLSLAKEQVENEKKQKEQLTRNLASVQKDLEDAKKKSLGYSGTGVLNKKTNIIIWCATLFLGIFLGLLFAKFTDSASSAPNVIVSDSTSKEKDSLHQDSIQQPTGKQVGSSDIKKEQPEPISTDKNGEVVKEGNVTKNDSVVFQEYYDAANDKWDPKAQYNLANCYYEGKGVGKNLTEAYRWYDKSARQGNANAQKKLGDMFLGGEGGVPKDPSQAVEWYKKAAENGNADAMYKLGYCYENGVGVGADNDKAKEWYQKYQKAKAQLKKLSNK